MQKESEENAKKKSKEHEETMEKTKRTIIALTSYYRCQT